MPLHPPADDERARAVSVLTRSSLNEMQSQGLGHHHDFGSVASTDNTRTGSPTRTASPTRSGSAGAKPLLQLLSTASAMLAIGAWRTAL